MSKGKHRKPKTTPKPHPLVREYAEPVTLDAEGRERLQRWLEDGAPTPVYRAGRPVPVVPWWGAEEAAHYESHEPDPPQERPDGWQGWRQIGYTSDEAARMPHDATFFHEKDYRRWMPEYVDSDTGPVADLIVRPDGEVRRVVRVNGLDSYDGHGEHHWTMQQIVAGEADEWLRHWAREVRERRAVLPNPAVWYDSDAAGRIIAQERLLPSGEVRRWSAPLLGYVPGLSLVERVTGG